MSLLHTVAALLAGFVLRFCQILIDSSLYLMIGFLTAGAIRVWARPAQVRAVFGAGRWSAPVRAWLAATLFLPVCALGVLPVLAELRRARVPRHALLTFAVAAPMLNPVALIAGISYLGPNLIGLLLLGSFLVAVGSGWLLGRGELEPSAGDEAETEAQEEALPVAGATGMRRLWAALVAAARDATGAPLGDVVVGVLGASAMAAVLSPAGMASGHFAGDGSALVRMALAAPLTYMTPDQVMTIVPEMVKFRQSNGAMFLVVALGVGLTLGQVRWTQRTFGLRTTARWLATVFALALVGAVALELVVRPVGTANADNDHFNSFSNPFEPFHALGGWPDLSGSLRRLAAGVDPLRWGIVAALGALVLAGVRLRMQGPRGTVAAALVGDAGRPPRLDSDAQPSLLERPVPGRVMGLLGGVGLLILAVVGVFAYYPAPSEAFADMSIIRADFFGELSGSSLDPARHHLDLWERQASKVWWGSLLRGRPATSQANDGLTQLRQALGDLRRALDQNQPARARSQSYRVGQIQDQCRQAFLAR